MNFDLLKRLCEAPGVPGREAPIRQVVLEALTPLTDEISVDVMGNVIGVKHGRPNAPKVMLAAHMDEIGFMVKHIDDKGFLRILPLGGWDARTMVAQRVYVHGHHGDTLLGALMPASKPIHLLTPEEANKPPKIEDFFVDLGLTVEEVKAKVEPGDPVTMARTCERIGDRILSKTLDDRLLVFVMIEALRMLGHHDCTIYAVATTQEEIGLRGAVASAFHLQPDIGIALDITLANDYPGAPEHDWVTKLGGGTAIKILDGSLICHPKLVRHFRDVAEQRNIPYQLEMLPRGGTDAGGIQRSRGGVPSFTLSVPTRYVHTVNECAAVSDIEATIALLAYWLEQAHMRTFGYGD